LERLKVPILAVIAAWTSEIAALDIETSIEAIFFTVEGLEFLSLPSI
jgi:hypothetical protein